MKKLIQALVLGLVLFFPSLGFAQPLTMDEALEGVCRVNTNEARGSGTVFSEDEEKYYIMTNGHVIGRARRGHLEFFQDGYKSAMIPFKTEYSAYKEGTALDLAVVSVKKKYFGRFPPRVIPLAPKGTEIKANDLVIAGGCPSAQWATAWKGRILRNAGAVISFNAAPIGGQSGSGVLVLVKDDKGELHTRLGILLAWRIGDGAWTDDGPNDYGAGLSLRQIYEIMEGNGQGHPIEASYTIVAEKDKEAEQLYKIDIDPKSQKPKRLTKACPHCGHKIEDHVVLPKDGGLRKTLKGEFMFCPELKMSDGSVRDTAEYYGGIRVGDLYNGEGLFPWCPWNRCPPPNEPPVLPPSNPNPPDGGGGFDGWPGRPDPGGPVDPPTDGFGKERQEYLDKIAELQEKLTNLENLSDSVQAELRTKLNSLEALSESLKAELGGTNSNLLEAQNAVSGLRDLLGAVEGQKDSLKNKIDGLNGHISDLEANGGHYMDGATGGNGNTVENVSFTLGGMSLGMLALKYGVPFLLRRRRKRKNGKNIDKDDEEGYDNGTRPSTPPPIERERGGCDCDGSHTHVHEHVHKHRHENEYVMPLDNLPEHRATEDVEDRTGKHGLNPQFVPYGFPVSEPYHQQPVAMQGLPPQFLNVPFSTRKQATAEQIMTVFGELVNEYQNDQTMTMSQVDTLMRHRLKQKFNLE